MIFKKGKPVQAIRLLIFISQPLYSALRASSAMS